MQGGVIQPDGTELYRAPTTVTGKTVRLTIL